MFLFGNRIEKQLKGYAKQSPELEIKFVTHTNPSPSRLLQVNHDGMIITGFSGMLESRDLDVRIVATQETFVTHIKKAGRNNKGQQLFYCSLPKSINPSWIRGEQRYLIYPHGAVRLLINTNQGERSASGPIWDFSQYGLSFINKSSIEFPVGTKIKHAFIKIEKMETQLLDLQVTGSRTQEVENKKEVILSCLFKSKAKSLEKMLLLCRKLEQT